MAIPAGIDTVTVQVSGIRDQSGRDAYSGTILATPSRPTTHIASGDIYPADPIPLVLSSGGGSQTFIASDADGFTDSNRYYTFDFTEVYTPDNIRVNMSPFKAMLPKSQPLVNLGKLAPVVIPTGPIVYYPAVLTIGDLVGDISLEALWTALQTVGAGSGSGSGSAEPTVTDRGIWGPGLNFPKNSVVTQGSGRYWANTAINGKTVFNTADGWVKLGVIEGTT